MLDKLVQILATPIGRGDQIRRRAPRETSTSTLDCENPADGLIVAFPKPAYGGFVTEAYEQKENSRGR
jgi:hypothetical protein